jgi:hypothetical protein
VRSGFRVSDGSEQGTVSDEAKGPRPSRADSDVSDESADVHVVVAVIVDVIVDGDGNSDVVVQMTRRRQRALAPWLACRSPPTRRPQEPSWDLRSTSTAARLTMYGEEALG